MRPAFRRGWEGEGKPNRRPGAGQRARSDRHTGAAILLWEREGKALGVPTQSGERRRSASLSRAAAQRRRPRTGRRRRTPCGGKQVPAGRCASAQPRQRGAAQTDRGRLARREARAPAGQHKDAAPSGARSAGERAPLEPAAHLLGRCGVSPLEGVDGDA